MVVVGTAGLRAVLIGLLPERIELGDADPGRDVRFSLVQPAVVQGLSGPVNQSQPIRKPGASNSPLPGQPPTGLQYKVRARAQQSAPSPDRRWCPPAKLVRPRLGQGAFRLAVASSYKQRCSGTGERTLPILDAAHNL